MAETLATLNIKSAVYQVPFSGKVEQATTTKTDHPAHAIVCGLLPMLTANALRLENIFEKLHKHTHIRSTHPHNSLLRKSLLQSGFS